MDRFCFDLICFVLGGFFVLFVLLFVCLFVCLFLCMYVCMCVRACVRVCVFAYSNLHELGVGVINGVRNADRAARAVKKKKAGYNGY